MKLITNFSHKDVLVYKKAVSIYSILDSSVVFEVRFDAYGQGGFKVSDCLALWASEDKLLELIKILSIVRELSAKKA